MKSGWVNRPQVTQGLFPESGNYVGVTGPCSRRTLLHTGALALVGGAGCTAGLGGDDSSENESSEPSPVATTGTTEEAATTVGQRTSRTTTAATEPPLAVENVAVQSSFFYGNHPDAAAVAGREATQFAFVELALVGSLQHLPSPEDIVLAADGRDFTGTLAPASTDGAWELHDRGRPYRVEPIQSGWVAFEVPAPLDADQVALAYESNGRRFSAPLDGEVIERLARPPAEFEVVAFDTPESVERGESFEMSVAVENASGVDGRFRAVLNRSRPSYAYRLVELEVPAGERREWTGRSDWSVRDSAEARFTLLTPGDDSDATVEIGPGTSTG